MTAKLNQTAPHYIRCIKPNGANRPMLFENANVLHQLRCGGVLEAGSASARSCIVVYPLDFMGSTEVYSCFTRSDTGGERHLFERDEF